jgi:hypothetical protein
MTARGGGQTANVDQVLIIPTQQIFSRRWSLAYQAPLCTQIARVNPARAREISKPGKRAALATEYRDEIGVSQVRWHRTG